MNELHSEAVKDSTLSLLKQLQGLSIFGGLRLVGGTALALQLGHRNSVDLDFFGNVSFTTDELERDLQKVGLGISIKSESKSIKIAEIENVKVDFVDYTNIAWLKPALVCDGLVLADLPDIAAMKLTAIAGRGSKKDFVDLYFLLNYFKIEQLLDFYQQKFSPDSVFHVVRSLTYFEDAEEDPLPEMYLPFHWANAKDRIRNELAKL